MKLSDFVIILKPISKLLRTKRLFFGTLALLIFLSSYWLWLDYRNFVKQPIIFAESERSLVLMPGSGINRLAKQLQTKGLIKHQIYLKILAKINPRFKNLKTGEYRLKPSMTPEQLLTQLSLGQVIQYAFTIIEGQTAYEILNNLQSENRLSPLKISDPQELLSLLKVDSSNLEGWLYPETYYFSKGDSALSVLKRATRNMQQILQQEWQQRALDLPYDSAYQALIMASIIEKETGIASEREQIAGVFVRRLQKKMRLQTDPTIIYGIGPNFNGDITWRDKRTATPYNTYIIKGLPPTPIAMPSQASIYAALHPASGNALYFVADGSGGHYFSETYAEHKQAVKRMLARNKKP